MATNKYKHTVMTVTFGPYTITVPASLKKWVQLGSSQASYHLAVNDDGSDVSNLR